MYWTRELKKKTEKYTQLQLWFANQQHPKDCARLHTRTFAFNYLAKCIVCRKRIEQNKREKKRCDMIAYTKYCYRASERHLHSHRRNISEKSEQNSKTSDVISFRTTRDEQSKQKWRRMKENTTFCLCFFSFRLFFFILWLLFSHRFFLRCHSIWCGRGWCKKRKRHV